MSAWAMQRRLASLRAVVDELSGLPDDRSSAGSLYVANGRTVVLIRKGSTGFCAFVDDNFEECVLAACATESQAAMSAVAELRRRARELETTIFLESING